MRCRLCLPRSGVSVAGGQLQPCPSLCAGVRPSRVSSAIPLSGICRPLPRLGKQQLGKAAEPPPRPAQLLRSAARTAFGRRQRVKCAPSQPGVSFLLSGATTGARVLPSPRSFRTTSAGLVSGSAPPAPSVPLELALSEPVLSPVPGGGSVLASVQAAASLSGYHTVISKCLLGCVLMSHILVV